MYQYNTSKYISHVALNEYTRYSEHGRQHTPYHPSAPAIENDKVLADGTIRVWLRATQYLKDNIECKQDVRNEQRKCETQ